MNKKMILPLLGLAMLILAMLLVVYFKSVEKNTKKQQQSIGQNEDVSQQENNSKENSFENESDQIIKENPEDATANSIEIEDDIDIEEINALEEDLNEIESLTNDSMLESLDSDLENF